MAQLLRDEYLACQGGVQRLRQLAEIGAFVDQAADPVAQQAVEQAGVAGAGEHHHGRAGVACAQFSDQVRAVGTVARHGEIGQHGVAVVAFDQVQQLGAARAADNLHQVGLQHDADAVQDDGMVVGDDDARVHAGSSKSEAAHLWWPPTILQTWPARRYRKVPNRTGLNPGSAVVQVPSADSRPLCAPCTGTLPTIG